MLSADVGSSAPTCATVWWSAGARRQPVSIPGHRQPDGGRQQLLDDRAARRVAVRHLHTEDRRQLLRVHVSHTHSKCSTREKLPQIEDRGQTARVTTLANSNP